MKSHRIGAGRVPQIRKMAIAVAIAALPCISGSALGVEIKVDNPDVQMRWDNTVRYNAGVRVGKIGDVGNNTSFDEGEYRFGRGDMVANRLDLLSEFDFVYKGRYGFRVSGAGWYDDAYSDARAKHNPNLPAASNAGSYYNDEFSDYTKRYYRGPSGEWLDAFVFGRFDLGEMPLTVKLGKHTVYWGESLGLSGSIHGIAYSQSPLDLRKGFATPGVEAKELFLPLNNISSQLVVSNELTVAAQYFFDWAPTRIPEGGTYLGPADFLTFGADRGSGAASFLLNGGITKPGKSGDWGLSARWSPDWLDGTAGIYYRNFTDKMLSITRIGSEYRDYFGEDIDLYGISLSKQIAGISFGAELSYRRNMPLAAQTLGRADGGAVLHPNGNPTLIGNTYQARGNTIHAVVNALGVIADTGLFNSAVWSAEMIYARLDKVTANPDMYFGEGYGVCDQSRQAALGAAYRDKWDQCATKDVFGLSLNFTPTWMQVFPGTDLSMPITFSKTLKGNAPVQLGGNEGNGNFSVGIAADVYSKYRFDLRYVGYFGETKRAAQPLIPGTNQITSANGLSTLLQDRGFLALTFKTTF